MDPAPEPVTYDKADYHAETVQEFGLPESHACHHTVYFLRWLLEHDLVSDELRAGAGPYDRHTLSCAAALRIYEEMDGVLGDDLLSDEGNAFAQHYFEFERGRYLADYRTVLLRNLPSEYHIALTDENYDKLKRLLDRRYEQWRDWRDRRAARPPWLPPADLPAPRPRRPGRGGSSGERDARPPRPDLGGRGHAEELPPAGRGASHAPASMPPSTLNSAPVV